MSNAPAEQPIRVFVSSPGNLRPERLLVVKVCRQLSQSMGVTIEPLLWEGGGRDEPDVPSFPAYVSGEGPQHEIDKRLWDEIGGCDIYVGMIWHRMGTPTGKWRSGTEAEYEGALQAQRETGRPSAIFFYEKRADPPLPEVDPAQLRKARKFIAELNGARLLRRFQDTDDLEGQLYPHLADAVRKVRPGLTPKEAPRLLVRRPAPLLPAGAGGGGAPADGTGRGAAPHRGGGIELAPDLLPVLALYGDRSKAQRGVHLLRRV